jgi:hypothetical protein
MHYTFHHIPKTGGSTLRIRLEDRADKKQISKLDYAVGHNTTKRTPGIHFTWLRDPLDRDISQFNYDMSKGESEADTFEDNCRLLAGNFITLWLDKNYLLQDTNVDINSKYMNVQQCLKNNFQKVFSTENFEQSWNEIADLLKIDKEPRLNTNRSYSDYKNLVSKENLSKEFLEWHKSYNSYDYKLFKEFCT